MAFCSAAARAASTGALLMLREILGFSASRICASLGCSPASAAWPTRSVTAPANAAQTMPFSPYRAAMTVLLLWRKHLIGRQLATSVIDTTQPAMR